MWISIVLAHPRERSLSHALTEAAGQALREADHTVVEHDLYAEGFDPVLPAHEIPRNGPVPALVSEYCREIASADGIVVVHPNWWGQPPAILKGWVDRVFRPGVAYEFVEGDSGEGIPRGLLKAKAAVVFNTSNTSPARERAVFGDPLERIWRDCVFGLCGVQDFYRRTFSVVVTSTAEQRSQWLAQARTLVLDAFGAGT